MMPATRNVPLFVFIFGHGMLDFRVEIGENTNGHVDFMEFARFREAATYCYVLWWLGRIPQIQCY